MVGLWVIGGVVAAMFYVYCAVDCVSIERGRVRGLPKAAWVAVILLFPLIGGILWLLIGRGRRSAVATTRRFTAPDDDPEFLRRLAKERDRELRRRRQDQKPAELEEKRTKRDDTDPRGRQDG